MKMSWNVALNKVKEIKDAYIDRFGADTLYDYSGMTCLDHWVGKLKVKEYEDIVLDLHKNELGDLLILRYRLPHPVNGMEFYKAYDGLMNECRSVVIDFRKEELVLVPFRKFRNLNECKETSEARIRELLRDAKIVEFADKLDGSMQSARFYDGRLVMSGSRSIDRNSSYRLDNGYRFIESHENYIRMLKDHPDLTFVFEYIFPDDIHVVDYSDREQGLYLIGIRDVTDGREYHYFEVREFAERYGTLTTIMSETALDDAMEFLKNVDGKEKEGFVLNIDGFRVKLKSDDYVNIHNSIWEIQNDNVLFQAVKNDVIDDAIAKLPKSMVDEVVRKRDLIVEFARNRERTAREYLERMSELGLSEKRDAMIWITENVPSDYESLVRSLYLGKEADYLKGFKAADILGEQ
jgi:hypothetical protein